MRDYHPKNECPSHEFAPSLDQAGTETCDWCGATRESPATLPGDISASVLVVVREGERKVAA